MYSEYRKKVAELLREFRAEAAGRQNAARIDQEYVQRFDHQFNEQRRHDYNKGTTVPGSYRSQPHRPIRFYAMITEPSFGLFLNDAKEKAKTRFALNEKYWFHEYIVDMARVTIRMLGRICFIRISPIDAFEFEFATSGKPIVLQTVTGEDFSFDAYRGLIVGVHVEMVEGKMLTVPVIRKQRRTAVGSTGNDVSIIGRHYMVSLFNEPVSYVKPVDQHNRVRYPDQLFESYAPVHPHTGIFLRSMTYGLGAGGQQYRSTLLTHHLRDVDFDIPWATNHNLNGIQYTYIRLNADWPRANGLQQVKHPEFGSREFAIYVDAYNQFHVFPTAAIEPFDGYNQNVNTMYVQRLLPDLPAWCYKPTEMASAQDPADYGNGHWAVDQPEADWKFNHLGTKAASIFYEREECTYDSTLFESTDGTTASDPLTQAEFNTYRQSFGVQSWHNASVANGYNDARYFVGPGIIEVSVNIELTGHDLEDFTASLEVREVRRPTTSSLCTFAVGYVWFDVPFGAKAKKVHADGTITDERIARAGQFVTIDAELYINTYTPNEPRIVWIYSAKDLDTNVELWTSDGGGPFLHIDLQTFSFVQYARIKEDNPERTLKAKDGDSFTYRTIPWETHHVGFIITIGGVQKEIIWPKLTPDEVKNKWNTIILAKGPTWAREQITRLANEEPGWQLMPLNDPHTWANDTYGNFLDYRLWRLTTIEDHLAGPHDAPADTQAIVDWLMCCYTAFPVFHTTVTAAPRFSWLAYEQIILHSLFVNSMSTFYVHPSGTWALWNNVHIYVPDGMPTPPYGEVVDLLPEFEVNERTIEHVILDRVHFELRTKDQVLGHRDTTFQELYNRAVAKGVQARTLEANIDQMADADLRATFEKEVFTYPTPPYDDVTWLDLKATWDGTNYWYPEGGIQGGGYHILGSPLATGQGALFGATFDHLWFNAPAYGGDIAFPALDTYHIRFCNPIVLQKVTKLS